MRKLKRWQIPLFAFAHFGPCMLSTIISVYLVDALQVAGFGSDVESWTFAAKTIVAVGLFSVLNLSVKFIFILPFVFSITPSPPPSCRRAGHDYGQ